MRINGDLVLPGLLIKQERQKEFGVLNDKFDQR